MGKAKVYTFTNQKGGVGKTTSALNIGGGLISFGFRVLFIDMDAQCNLTFALGGKRKVASSRELLTNEVNVLDAIQHLNEGDLIPGSPNLSTMDMELTGEDKALRLKKALEPVMDVYDYIIIDTPPTLGIVTINILAVANVVIVPVTVDIFSLQGAGQLYRTICAVKDYCNPDLEVGGILITTSNVDSNFDKQIMDAFLKTANILKTKVYSTMIEVSSNIKDSIAYGKSIFEYAPNSVQTKKYRELIKEVFNL